MYGSLSTFVCVCNAYITFNNDQSRVLFKIAIKLDYIGHIFETICIACIAFTSQYLINIFLMLKGDCLIQG